MLDLLVLAGTVALAWPLGHYLAAVMRGDARRSDLLFGWLERPVYALLGTRPQAGMTRRGYAWAFGLSNLLLAAVVWSIFMTQAWLPLNPDGIPDMRWDLALHTAVSFLTNTDPSVHGHQPALAGLCHAAGRDRSRAWACWPAAGRTSWCWTWGCRTGTASRCCGSCDSGPSC